MKRFQLNDRVLVNIADTATWNRSVACALQGKAGTVIEVKTAHNNGRKDVPLLVPKYFVKFDSPAGPTARGMKYDGFWFERHDLKEAA